MNLEPAEEYTFQGAIWRLEADAATGWLALEVRNAQTLQVSFSVLNPLTGKKLLDHYALPEPWWITLAAVQDQVLYVQGFEKSQQLGLPKGLTAINIPTREVLFQAPHLLFSQVQPRGLLLASADGVQALYHPRTGVLLQAEPTETSPDLQKESKTACPWHRPMVYKPESAYFKELAGFILHQEGQVAEQEIAYLETDTIFCLCYFLRKENDRFMNFLVTYTLGGEPLGKVCLSENAATIGEPGFFTLGNKLFVLTEASKLVSYTLPHSL